MNNQWLIIPEYEHLEESVALAKEYGAAFEYNDFYLPAVYQSKSRVEELIKRYTGLDRDRSKDTMHGAFLDLAPSSQDSVLKKYSGEMMEQSMEIAKRLGVRGVVFHAGLVSGVENAPYIENWLNCMEELFDKFAQEYPGIGIYLENTVERVPDYHVELMKRICKDTKQTCDEEPEKQTSDIEGIEPTNRIGLCLDYAHAALTTTDSEEWVKAFKPYIAHIHINDNDLKRDLHAVPGEGKIDFNGFKTLLEKYGIQVPILLELRGIEAQKKSLEYMEQL